MNTEVNKLTSDIESLKTQKRLLISQVNKLQTEYEDKKRLEEENFNKTIQQMKERVLKEEKKFSRRNKKQTKHIHVQTDEIITPIIETTELAIMTEPLLELEMEDNINNRTIEHIDMEVQVEEEKQTFEEIAIQCDLMPPVQEVSRSFVFEREEEINIFTDETKKEECLSTVSSYMRKYYVHNYHILKQIQRIKEIIYLKETGIINATPKNLYIFNYSFEFIQFTNVLKCPLTLIFMGKEKPLFSLTYDIYNKKQNTFRFTNLLTKEIISIAHDIPFNTKYVIKIDIISNNNYKITLNREKIFDFELNDEFVGFFTNISSNIWIK